MLSTQSITPICNKHNVELSKHNNNFCLTFTCKNKEYDLTKFANFNLYTMLFELNREILSDMEIKSINKNEIELLYLFYPLADSLGISKKYIYVKINRHIKDNEVIFKSENLPYINKNHNEYEVINVNNSSMYIQFTSNNEFKFKYIFDLDIEDEIPIYMSNMIGMLMKKIFMKLKTFIENL